jgi:hypothetical protein
VTPRALRRTRHPAAGLLVLALCLAGCRGVQINGDSSSVSSSSSGSGGDSDDPSGTRVDTASYTIGQPVGGISLDADAGSVQVEAADGPVSVTETAHYTDDKPPSDHKVDGTTLTLTGGDCAHVRTANGRCQIDWTIRAPAATALELKGGAGEITVTGFAGPIKARGGAGGITGHRLTSREVDAKAGSGGVELTFVQPPDRVRATASAGGVDLTLPAGTRYDVRAHADTSDPDVEVDTDDSAPHKIIARTGAGSVHVDNG